MSSRLRTALVALLVAMGLSTAVAGTATASETSAESTYYCRAHYTGIYEDLANTFKPAPLNRLQERQEVTIKRDPANATFIEILRVKVDGTWVTVPSSATDHDYVRRSKLLCVMPRAHPGYGWGWGTP